MINAIFMRKMSMMAKRVRLHPQIITKLIISGCNLCRRGVQRIDIYREVNCKRSLPLK